MRTALYVAAALGLLATPAAAQETPAARTVQLEAHKSIASWEANNLVGVHPQVENAIATDISKAIRDNPRTNGMSELQLQTLTTKSVDDYMTASFVTGKVVRPKLVVAKNAGGGADFSFNPLDIFSIPVSLAPELILHTNSPERSFQFGATAMDRVEADHYRVPSGPVEITVGYTGKPPCVVRVTIHSGQNLVDCTFR